MFIIDLRNKQVSDNHFSVIDNDNVDEVLIYSSFTQYASGYSVYLKVESDDKTYCDKIAISSENISVEDDALVIDWTMQGLETHYKQIAIQLQFERNDNSGTVIAQSRKVSITLADTIEVGEHIERVYPHVLSDLERKLKELEARVEALEGN